VRSIIEVDEIVILNTQIYVFASIPQMFEAFQRNPFRMVIGVLCYFVCSTIF